MASKTKSSAKVLFVEDEPSLQDAVKEILQQEGFSVLSATDGESGLALAREQKPDLILLDLILPKTHGFDVLQALKGDEATSSIPVIVLTNLEGLGDVERALTLGATSYLVKANYELEDIVAKVRDALARS